MLSKQSHQCCSRRKHGQTIHPIEIFISINDHIGSKKTKKNQPLNSEKNEIVFLVSNIKNLGF